MSYGGRAFMPTAGDAGWPHDRPRLTGGPRDVLVGTKELVTDRIDQSNDANSYIQASEPHNTPAQSFMPPLKTYIVEDSPVIRENLIAALEEMVPVQVVGTAEDEATAVGWLSKPSNECNLVIVDIFLKAGSGLGVLRAAGDASKPFKLVVLSNYATPDMRRKCLELGADRVFDKSNEIDALILYCERLASNDHSGFTALS